ncbi:mandelate racemase/muconate lactonizing enzyme family protein [Brevibacterium sp. RIT 803]|uniref:mandelate racemase/muconate lactonizing enzyme family protein n=1 Tax=Brevibacterium sp. RIT 803 TaxID=2810210 RepID=UPI00194DFBB7|nr:mandelate racemase/muconate lactonizing enzyme family protein [Brevibacterium sp. RIT 803]MBM6592219.1 mandelate racemase/muconate lactonizing enzyme family protein [Brevibacterium sp. RIT 803]
MAITSVSARGVRVPVTVDISQSTRKLNQRDYVIVQIRDSKSEFVGEGLSYVGTAGAKSAVELIDDVLSSTIFGGDPADTSGLYARLYQEGLMQGRRGILIRCIAAIDTALWDLAAKRAGLPLASMLGGHTGPVPAYASGGYYKAGDTDRPQTVREEIEFNKSLGFKDHKIKVGGASVKEDAERIKAAISVLDSNERLAVDANNAYKTPAEAIHATRSLEAATEGHGLWWMEEPLTPDDIAGHARISRSVDTPIATGEVHQTRHEFLQLLQQDAASILQTDAGVVGGITEWVTIARTALSFGVPVAPHWHANIHVHLVASAENGLVVEHFAKAKGIYNMEELMTPESRLEFKDGSVIVPDRPGIGWEFDTDKIARYEVK